MPNTTKIDLHKNIDTLRKIYFRNNEQKHFFGPNTKRQSLALIIAVLSFPFAMNYAVAKDESWILLVASILLAIICFGYWKTALPIIKWKKSLEVYFELIKQAKETHLEYNNQFIAHIQDEEEQKLNWKAVDRAMVNDNFIWLISSTTNILLPRDCMNENQYEVLALKVLEKVENVENS